MVLLAICMWASNVLQMSSNQFLQLEENFDNYLAQPLHFRGKNTDAPINDLPKVLQPLKGYLTLQNLAKVSQITRGKSLCSLGALHGPTSSGLQLPLTSSPTTLHLTVLQPHSLLILPQVHPPCSYLRAFAHDCQNALFQLLDASSLPLKFAQISPTQ